jgi:hypothetical protein
LIFLFEGFIGQAFEWEGFSTGVDQEVSADYLYASSIIVHQYIKKITVQTICPATSSPPDNPKTSFAQTYFAVQTRRGGRAPTSRFAGLMPFGHFV